MRISSVLVLVEASNKNTAMMCSRRHYQCEPTNSLKLWIDFISTSYIDNASPKIISLNLSASGLTGEILEFV